jgi:hypothetical protein
VLDRGVVRDVVEDQLEAEPVRFGGERVEVLQGPEDGVDVLVVGDVVAEVGHRRAVERREPDAVDAQPLQVRQPLPDALEVTGAVAV